MDLLQLAPYIGGVGLVAIIIIAMFLRYMSMLQTGLNNVYSNRLEALQTQIDALENKRSINVSDLYEKVGDVEKAVMKLNVSISDNYVRKTDCDRKHS